MSNLESIVPPLEDCQLIPYITKDRIHVYFNDSALVHAYSEPEMGWQILPREMVQFNDCPIIPAPTLAEIMDALPKTIDTSILIIYPTFDDDGDGWEVAYNEKTNECDNNIIIAALRLWLKIHEVGK